MENFDIIPDIHGQLSKLTELLRKLGFKNHGGGEGAWSHPTRRALFLGDYIDRGPEVLKTLKVIRSMVDHGNAIALMGNHEFNAIAYHTLGDDGKPLRAHNTKNISQHEATLKSFHGKENELRDYLNWFKTLPLFFETNSFCAVHACWSLKHIDFLKKEMLSGKTLKDRE
jgi:Calcineurin-like phosphoesterase